MIRGNYIPLNRTITSGDYRNASCLPRIPRSDQDSKVCKQLISSSVTLCSYYLGKQDIVCGKISESSTIVAVYIYLV